MNQNLKKANSLLWGALILVTLMIPNAVLSQCTTVDTQDYSGTPCGYGLYTGQSIQLETNSYLQSVSLSICTGTESHLVIRAYNGEGNDWNAGVIIGSANETYPASGETQDCLPSQNGLTSYVSRTFSFTDVPLEGGIPYVLHLTSGVAATGCAVNYPQGNAFKNNGNPETDLVFTLDFCPAPGLTFGCTDSQACNFDPTASEDNGSCQTIDCAGVCGGGATLDICGICNGDGSTCHGCTDPTACNYDDQAVTDDGSCQTYDCNGDCGGSAFIASCGACIGGGTDLDETACNVCPNQETQSHLESPCGVGLLYGQSFQVSNTGHLYSVTLSVCAAQESHLAIRRSNGTESDWADGELIGTAQNSNPTAGTLSDCLPSGNGFSNYAQRTFEFSGIALAEATSYVMVLESAVAASGCSTPYANGVAFSSSSPVSGEDLILEIIHCPDETIVFGCTDADACNFDPTATAEDGSCLEEDCNGLCGGTAYLDPDCGCLESISEAGSCFGCTDNTACNFDASATLSDNSCLFLDCHGDCGGSAVESDCGCVGGNTGYLQENCLDGCLTEIISSGTTACAPGLLKGQSFTAETTGLLKAVRLRTCCALDAQLAIKSHVDQTECDDSEAWNSGALLSSSNTIESTCEGLANCLPSSGTENYEWKTFFFDDIPLKSGDMYTLELLSGVAIASCENDYAGGTAYGSNQAVDQDLIMEILTCESPIVWGCMDASACSGYNALATHDDQSCIYEDCNGDCGGSAKETDCGCIGGITGIREEQCLNGTIGNFIGNDTQTCMTSLFGQEFLMTGDGFLAFCALHVDPSIDQRIRLERLDGPLAGTHLGEATPEAQDLSCHEPGERMWTAFAFDQEIALEGGMNYRLVFVDGSGSNTCVPGYSSGSGLNQSLNDTGMDMAFQLVYHSSSAEELTWGCTDPSFCNYNSAATNDNGSCAPADCNGDCAGTAQFIEGCGCVGGNTGIEPSSCHGCTNPSACNYAASALIDDGSCAFVIDCHGDCGGSANLTEACGCVGGDTGISTAQCMDKCFGYPAISSLNVNVDIQGIGYKNGGQTFEAPSTGFLTGTSIQVLDEPSTEMNVELRQMDGIQPNGGTLLASQALSTWEATPDGYTVFVEWTNPELLTEGESYAIVLIGDGWKYPLASGLGITGNSFSSFGGLNSSLDLFLELLLCTDLYGCTSPVACNYDAWATADDESCAYAGPGIDCNGNPCAADTDGDGICDGVDLDMDNPSICMDGDGDGCDDCSSGTYNPQMDGPDADGDGLCDAGDLCSNPEADNFNDPANGPCRGTCDTAPIFNGIQVNSPASDPWTEDGTILTSTALGSMLFVSDSDFEATTLQLIGINGAPNYTLDMPLDPLDFVTPGRYSAMVFNAEGCPGVATVVHGSAFGQTPIAFPLIMTYYLCCGGCGITDIDTDGICDNEDNCIDRNSPNYNDPNNVPCGDGCTDPSATNYDVNAELDDGSCLSDGCTDPSAANYDANADVDDGSCVHEGCTDPSAANYDVNAELDDGSCLSDGCTDPSAANYDANADVDDGSCVHEGCTDPSAANYDANADVDDGSCLSGGCTDPTAANYDANAGADDGSCQYPGCTDSNASNYDPNANVNDGSCLSAGCTDPTAANYNANAGADDGSCQYPGCTDSSASNYDPNANVNDGSCLSAGCTDPTAANYNASADFDDGSCLSGGCTDPTAANYDANAGADDGSCQYPGCTDPSASNYDPNANVNDGSCLSAGCTDPTAANYDANAGADDGSCQFPGCTDPSASNYDPNANVNDGSCAANGCDAADHTIQTGSFYFTPSSLSIAVGESVAWVNEGGVHNVNGNTSTITGQSFGNPEAFSLPTSSGDSGDSGGDSGAASQLLNQTLNVNGTSRTYIEYLPAGFDNAQNLPLVLSFHGGSDQAQIQLNQADLRNRADQDGFVLVYPNAIPDPNDGGSTNWQITVSGTLPYTNPNPHSDIDFIDALIDELASSRNIDTTRVYAMGYSNGGGFTFDLACRLNHKITGIGVASRTMYAETYSACNVVHPTPVVTILGTADAESPYEGLTYDGTLYFHGSDEVNNFWINANGLNSTPVVTNVPNINTSDGSTAELYAWASPDGCHELLHYKVIGGGHDWPGHSGNLDFISHEVIWDALSQHNMNGRIGCGTNTGNTTGSQSPCMGTVTFTVPGVYQYDCSIGSHAAAGMVGTITVGTGGCTNSAASNYNAAADFDDGSCDGVEND